MLEKFCRHQRNKYLQTNSQNGKKDTLLSEDYLIEFERDDRLIGASISFTAADASVRAGLHEHDSELL